MIAHEKIKELMKEKGISSIQLATAVGVSQAMMSYILNGLREPNVATLARMAKMLECTVDDLLVASEGA